MKTSIKDATKLRQQPKKFLSYGKARAQTIFMDECHCTTGILVINQNNDFLITKC